MQINSTKIKSFTLAELLVVMLITAIIAGLAFSVLNLVHDQIRSIENNFKKTTALSLCEQRLWQDLNTYNTVTYTQDILTMASDVDTITYTFNPDYIIREYDTIKSKISIEKIFYEGREVKTGNVDAIKLTSPDIKGYSIFISKENDAALKMNGNGV